MSKHRRGFLQEYRSSFQARQAARMRLPAWLALLMPLMAISFISVFTVASIVLLCSLHRFLHPEITFGAMSGAAFALIFFSSLFGVIVPALMLLNRCLRAVPLLRRIFEENSKGEHGASYQESMSGLRKMATIIVPPALTLAIIGAIEPWAF